MVETSRINWAYDSSRPYKEGKTTTCVFSQLSSKQLLFIFLSIFRGDNEKPDDSLEKVTMNCLQFYDAICRNDHGVHDDLKSCFIFYLTCSLRR